MHRHVSFGLFITLSLLLLAACAAPAAGPGAPAAPAAASSAPAAAPAQSQAPATLQPTTAAQPTQTAAAQPATAPAAPATTAGAASQPSSAAAPAAGALRLVIDPSASQASYKAREQLAGRDLPNDAIGTTRGVSGAIVLQPDGALVPGQSKFVVDLSQLQSDVRMRDNFIKGNTLQTAQYPTATFVPTRVEGLPSPLPTSGSVTFQITGDMTVRDVTHPMTWQVTAQIAGDQVTGTATSSFTFEDFKLTQPKVARVLSIEDKLGLELQFKLVKS